MPPQTGYKYVKFKSEDWEKVYRERIGDIISTARQHNVDVIWVGPPNMRKNTLSDGMKFLSSSTNLKLKTTVKFTFRSMMSLNIKAIPILTISVMRVVPLNCEVVTGSISAEKVNN